MNVNSKKLNRAYKSECKGFSSTIRYIYETSKEKKQQLPDLPSKDDKSDNAKQLRAEYKAAKDSNEIIDMCISIVTAFQITSNDLKRNARNDLRLKICGYIPNIDVYGFGVKFVKMNDYITAECRQKLGIEPYKVVESDWMERICDAANNVKADVHKTYKITVLPTVKDGQIQFASDNTKLTTAGNITDKDGNVYDESTTAKIYDIIDKHYIVASKANSDGKRAKEKSYDENLKEYESNSGNDNARKRTDNLFSSEAA